MRNMARCENLPRGGLQGVRTARQPSIGSDLPDIPANVSARIPLVNQNVRGSRVEVKLVRNLEQAHKSDYASGQNLRSEDELRLT